VERDGMISANPAGAPTRIRAVATAYHPDERLSAVVDAALESCVEVIVVDNTPDGAPSLAEKLDQDGVRVLRSGSNLGLGGALNLGIKQLAPDTEAVLFLDQDSILDPALVAGLAAHLADPTIGIAAPAPWDAEHGVYYETLSRFKPEVADQDAVITSGMLVRREVLDLVGGFREDFFVDFIDIEFCLRARRAGVRIIRDKRLKLEHTIGERQEHRVLTIKVHTTQHPIWRIYWIARNGVVLLREHYRTAPMWSFNTALYLVRWFFVRGIFERPHLRRMSTILRGFADGVTGRTTDTYIPAGAHLVPAEKR
jgi:rhamnosyltransferase